jgi:hypothetical protein
MVAVMSINADSSNPPAKPRWLIFSHGFNMDGRAASQTITDKIPHLAESVCPVVVSAHTGRKDRLVEHHQVHGWAPSALKFDIRHSLKHRFKNRWIYSIAKGVLTSLLAPFYGLEKLFIRLESQWSWFLPAYLTSLWLTRRHAFSAIYSTGGANSAHLAGYLLWKTTGLPWIAEIHDPMVHRAWGGSRQSLRWSAWVEGLICRHATAAFWFTDAALERARSRHPGLALRGKVIVPGAACPDFTGIEYRKSEQMRIGHFGSLNASRNLSVFLEGLSIVFRAHPEIAAQIKVDIYGTKMDSVSKKAMEQFALGGVVCVHGRLEWDEKSQKTGRQRVLEAMRTADVLLLLHGTDAFCEEYIPSKLYEYLWTQRPVLGLTWQNPMLDRILTEHGHTAAVADSAGTVADAILNLWRKWRNAGLPDTPVANRYTTEEAVRQILELVPATGNRH